MKWWLCGGEIDAVETIHRPLYWLGEWSIPVNNASKQHVLLLRNSLCFSVVQSVVTCAPLQLTCTKEESLGDLVAHLLNPQPQVLKLKLSFYCSCVWLKPSVCLSCISWRFLFQFNRVYLQMYGEMCCQTQGWKWAWSHVEYWADWIK